MIMVDCKGLVIEVITSAKKKCLNLTLPNGEIKMLPRVFASWILPFRYRIWNGMKHMSKNERSRTIVKAQNDASVKLSCMMIIAICPPRHRHQTKLKMIASL